MNGEKLSVGDSGDQVSRLHGNLKSHGLEISNEEIKRKFFGPSTRDAVGEFQKSQGIDPSCEVCEKTAAMLDNRPLIRSIPRGMFPPSVGPRVGERPINGSAATVDAEPPLVSGGKLPSKP